MLCEKLEYRGSNCGTVLLVVLREWNNGGCKRCGWRVVAMVWCRRRAYSSVWAGSGADFPAPIGRDDEIGQGCGGFLGEGLEGRALKTSLRSE